MGNRISSEKQPSCSSQQLNTVLNVLENTQNISNYYATLLTNQPLPIVLDEYRNFNNISEEYFNKTRNEKKSDITSEYVLLSKKQKEQKEDSPILIKHIQTLSYYDFYNYLSKFKIYYENTSVTAEIRQQMILEVFNNSYKIQKHLIDELWLTCN
jgi:hypothetical protein